MISKTAKNAFFTLLRAGLWIDMEPELAVFPLPDEEWEAIYVLSVQQTVQAIVFDGLLKLPNQYLPPKGLLLRWTADTDRIERRNRTMNQAVGELGELFADHSLQALLLKGQGVAMCYENPSHRVCGDIDWCFASKGAYEKANILIQSCGKKLYSPELSSNYVWNEIEVEHHYRMIDINNPFCYGYIQELIHGEQKYTSIKEILGKNVYLPSSLLAILIVNTHILKHLLGLGVGMRQLCDSARIYFEHNDSIDKAQLLQVYHRLGVHRWIQLLHQVLVDFVGMPEDSLPFPLERSRKSDWMISEIMYSGNFGYHDIRFGSSDASLRSGRGNIVWRYMRNLGNYFSLVPGEAFWLPLVKLGTRLNKWIYK